MNFVQCVGFHLSGLFSTSTLYFDANFVPIQMRRHRSGLTTVEVPSLAESPVFSCAFPALVFMDEFAQVVAGRIIITSSHTLLHKLTE